MENNKCDVILAHGVVATMDDANRLVADGAVALRAGKIVAVGPAAEVLREFTATEVIDCTDCAIMPGLVNCHTHVPMTLLRGLADDLRLDVWLYGYMLPVEKKFVSPAFVKLGAQLAAAEMIRSGVTCVNDMYYFEDTIAQTLADAGMRALCSQTIMQFPTPDAASADESLEACEAFVAKWKDHELIVPVVAPHAPYTCSGQLMRACAEIAIKHDVPLHIHISETEQEVIDCKRINNMPSVNWIHKWGVLEAKVIAAHCVWIDRDEMRMLKKHGATIAHNPAANLKLASGIAALTDMLDEGVTVGIGTDGPASNNDLDHFEEMRLAALLAKGSTRNPVAVPARQAMRMATIEGARALHIGDKTGSLEPGKAGDVIVVNLDTLHNTPAYWKLARDPEALYTQIVYSGKAGDVRDVFIQGRPVMRARALLTLDETGIRAQANETARQIDQFLVEREGDVLRKLAAIGGVTQSESFEVQVKARLSDATAIIASVQNQTNGLKVLRHVHYRQYDTYFYFDNDPSRLRYREDERLDENGGVLGSRYRLTLVGATGEREYDHSVLLSRVRFFSSADRSLRFYREYFKPTREVSIEKDRLRWEVAFGDQEIFINIDRLVEPSAAGNDMFLEIKTRTWSLKDAQRKAATIGDLLMRFGITDAQLLRQEYVEIAT